MDWIGCGSEYAELSWIGLDWVIKLLDWIGLDWILQNGPMSNSVVHYINIFGGSYCPLTEFCQVQNSLYVQVLRSPILAVHSTPAADVSQTLRRGGRNGITELSQTAPAIFGWAAITLGIGPHSSLIYILLICIYNK